MSEQVSLGLSRSRLRFDSVVSLEQCCGGQRGPFSSLPASVWKKDEGFLSPQSSYIIPGGGLRKDTLWLSLLKLLLGEIKEDMFTSGGG